MFNIEYKNDGKKEKNKFLPDDFSERIINKICNQPDTGENVLIRDIIISNNNRFLFSAERSKIIMLNTDNIDRIKFDNEQVMGSKSVRNIPDRDCFKENENRVEFIFHNDQAKDWACMAIDKHDNYLLAASEYCDLTIFSVRNYNCNSKPIRYFSSVHSNYITRILISPCNEYVFTCSAIANDIKVFDFCELFNLDADYDITNPEVIDAEISRSK